MAAFDVAEAVPTLGHDRRRHRRSHADLRVFGEQIGQGRVVDDADVGRPRQKNRRLQRARCAIPDKPGHLAIAIEDIMADR